MMPIDYVIPFVDSSDMVRVVWGSVPPSVYTDTIKNSVRLIRGKGSPSLTVS